MRSDRRGQSSVLSRGALFHPPNARPGVTRSVSASAHTFGRHTLVTAPEAALARGLGYPRTRTNTHVAEHTGTRKDSQARRPCSSLLVMNALGRNRRNRRRKGGSPGRARGHSCARTHTIHTRAVEASGLDPLNTVCERHTCRPRAAEVAMAGGGGTAKVATPPSVGRRLLLLRRCCSAVAAPPWRLRCRGSVVAVLLSRLRCRGAAAQLLLILGPYVCAVASSGI